MGVGGRGLRLTVEVTHVGHDLLPMGVGWLPYFAFNSGDRRQARLRLPTRGRLLVNNDDEVMPTGEATPVGVTPYDFTSDHGAALDDLYPDDCFAKPSALAPEMAKSTNPFRYFDSSPEVVRLVVMRYVRYPLSARNDVQMNARTARKGKSMNDRVRYEVTGGVADVRFCRPEKLNAFDTAMNEALVETIDALGRRKDVRCVVLSGDGRAFCAGVDLDGLGKREPGSLLPRLAGPANKAQQAAYGWRTLPQPVIAAVHGYAFGAGFQIMLGADMRIAAPGTQLSIMEARWGLVPDVAGIALLRNLVRDDVMRELTYTARRFDASEGLRLGVITRVAEDPHAEAMALARTIAANSPDAMRAAKRLMNLMADAQAAEILLAESVEQTRLIASANHRETVAAANEQRAPIFPDPA